MLVGDLDQCTERCKKLEKMGGDEVILEIDGYGHRMNLRRVEMFGKYARPEFNHPQTIPENDWEALGVAMEQYQL